MYDREDSGFYREAVSIKKYYKDIKKIEVLSGDKQVALAVRAKAGDQEAFKELVSTNLRFVVSIAKEYQYSGLALEDLIAEGNLGLMQAVEKFDETKGFKFISYAVWWIRHALIKAVHDYSKNIRLPVNRINSINKIVKTKEYLIQKLGRDPSDEEVMEMIGDEITESDLRSFNINGNLEVSIDDKVNDDSETEVRDFLKGDSYQKFEEHLNHKALQNELSELFSVLTSREITILEMYFGMNGYQTSTLSEIGKHLGLTNERVRQIKEDTLRRLRVFEKSSSLKEFLNTNLGSGE
jgi:RNA polymerase primary sigma factor